MPSSFTPIFIPGLILTGDLFAAQMVHLQSPYPPQLANTLGRDSITEMARDALALADGPLVPVGLSMGGYVAMERRQRRGPLKPLSLVPTSGDGRLWTDRPTLHAAPPVRPLARNLRAADRQCIVRAYGPRGSRIFAEKALCGASSKR